MATVGVKTIDAVNTLRPTMTTDLNKRATGRDESLHQAMRNAYRRGNYYVIHHNRGVMRCTVRQYNMYFRFWGWD